MNFLTTSLLCLMCISLYAGTTKQRGIALLKNMRAHNSVNSNPLQKTEQTFSSINPNNLLKMDITYILQNPKEHVEAEGYKVEYLIGKLKELPWQNIQYNPQYADDYLSAGEVYYLKKAGTLK